MNKTSKIKPLLALVIAALVAAGCASTSSAPPALVEARNTVSAASSDPNVLANAPLELKRATDALGRAEYALTKGENIDVNHNAYLATQRARTAIAAGNAKASEDMIRTAEVERERVRADARTREAQRAQANAAVARADARDARTDAEIQRQQAAAAQQQSAASQQQASIAQRDAAAAASQAANAQAQAANAQNQAASAQAQAAASDAYAASLARQLAALEALKTDRGLVITLGDVLFEFNRADVKPSAQARLGQLADFLKEYPDRRVSIEGHTDNIGSVNYNVELSKRRADAIKAELVARGISPDRIATIGYGKDFPVAANDTDTNRAINRRVEVVIANPGQAVAIRR